MQNVVKDDKKALHSFLSEALDNCDLIISSGGVQWGDMITFEMYLWI